MKKLIYTLLGIIAVAVVGTLVFLNIPKASSKNKEAEITISAIDLFNDFESNEQKSNNLYNGKIIQVEGKILAVSKDEQESTVIILDVEDQFDGVLCTLEENPKNKLSVGDQIKVKGQCNGFLSGVVMMNKCVLVE